MAEEVKKYSGYGYHGGGRKPTGIKRVSINISGQPEEIELLKKKASDAGKNVSRFILDMVIQDSSEKHDDLENLVKRCNELNKFWRDKANGF